MFKFHSFLSFTKSILDFLPTENIAIEMFTENLCSLIIDRIFRID